MPDAKAKTIIVCTREYEGGKLVYRKIEVTRSLDRTPPERDTAFDVAGFAEKVTPKPI